MAENRKKKRVIGRCEDCLYYDVDDESGEWECRVAMDEDEYYRYTQHDTAGCPYYRYYDEYKSVAHQN